MNSYFENRPLFNRDLKSEKKLSSATCYIDSSGFVINGKSNIDASLQIAKNSSVKILHTAFRTDVSKSVARFEDYFPIFIDIKGKKNNYQSIINSDLNVNGMPNSGISILCENTYRLRYPRSFGKINISNKDKIYVSEVLENSMFYSYDIRVNADSFSSDMRFENLDLVNLKINVFKLKNRDSQIAVKHFLNFYDFTLKDDQWYLFSPKEIKITNRKKTVYSYFSSAGEDSCYYANGYESPILILDYNIKYIVENEDKKDLPFYFDMHPEGLFRHPYSEFENDINTDRINLMVSFHYYGTDIGYDYSQSDIDPYFSIDSRKNPSYNPDSIYYACSSKRYFGNKILIGKRRISEILGYYGKSAPNTSSFLFDKNGDYVIYDLFNHVSGKVLPIYVIDLSNDVLINENNINILKLNSKEAAISNQNTDVIEYKLVGDIFIDLSELVNYIGNNLKFDKSLQGSTVVISIDSSIIDGGIGAKNSISYLYQKMFGNKTDIDIKIDSFLNEMKKSIKRGGAFEVAVKFT